MAARGDFTFSEAFSGQDFTATIYLVRDPHYQRPAKYVPGETFLCPFLRFLSENPSLFIGYEAIVSQRVLDFPWLLHYGCVDFGFLPGSVCMAIVSCYLLACC